jgi:type I restriction enzyme M protein
MPTNLKDLEDRLWDAADQLRANSDLKLSEYSISVHGVYLDAGSFKIIFAALFCL